MGYTDETLEASILGSTFLDLFVFGEDFLTSFQSVERPVAEIFAFLGNVVVSTGTREGDGCMTLDDDAFCLVFCFLSESVTLVALCVLDTLVDFGTTSSFPRRVACGRFLDLDDDELDTDAKAEGVGERFELPSGCSEAERFGPTAAELPGTD